MEKNTSQIKFDISEIISVEKGNIGKAKTGEIPIEQCVVAFSIKPNGYERKVKALLKGKIAFYTYLTYLENLYAKADALSDGEDFFMVKIPSAGFTGEIREQRTDEVVYHNIKELEFVFHYKVIQK